MDSWRNHCRNQCEHSSSSCSCSSSVELFSIEFNLSTTISIAPEMYDTLREYNININIIVIIVLYLLTHSNGSVPFH
jgi:hypothetical protein